MVDKQLEPKKDEKLKTNMKGERERFKQGQTRPTLTTTFTFLTNGMKVKKTKET
jgi:hypothetical protein